MKNEDAALAAFFIAYFSLFLFGIAVAIFLTICKYKIFVKAGQEGWKAIIPYYNTYVLTCDIAGKDLLTFALHFIPFVNIYASIVTHIGLAKSFGKDEGYGIGLSFLSIVFYPMLAFSKTIKYIGPGGNNPIKDSSNSLTNDWQNKDTNNPPTA